MSVFEQCHAACPAGSGDQGMLATCNKSCKTSHDCTPPFTIPHILITPDVNDLVHNAHVGREPTNQIAQMTNTFGEKVTLS